MPGRAFLEIADIANEQYGYITPADAREHDIDPMNLVRMAERGTLERRATGVYRLPLTPPGPLDAYMEAVLWPQGLRGVLASETALDLYELSDVSPATIHIAIPPEHRVRREVPETYRIRHELLDPDDVTLFEGIPIVTPARAIRQAAADHLGPALIAQAIDHGERNGRLTRREATELRRELGVVRGVGVRR